MEYKDYEEIAQKLNEKIYERNSYWFYGQIKRLMPTLADIVKKKDIEITKFDKTELNLGEMQTLVLDFLRDLDPSLEEKALDVLEDLEHTVVFVSKPQEKSKGNSVGLRELRGKNGKPLKNSPRVEIRLHPKNDTMGIVVVGHEYGHILSQRIQQKAFQKTDCIGEIEGVFFEKIFADWLVKKKVISKTERAKMDVAWNNNFINSVRVICDEYDLLNRLQRPTSADDLIKVEKDLQDKNRLGRLEVLKHRINVFINGDKGKDIHGEYEFRYVVGEIVASALYEDFKKNPKEATANFKEYLAHNAEYEFYVKKKVEKDGKLLENYVLEPKEVDKCFKTLLGENYKQKIEKTINEFQKEKTV